ncbi:MAG: bacterial Ig-like domain-containing protein [Clostridia bacterium]
MKHKLSLLLIILCVLAAVTLAACAGEVSPPKEVKEISVKSFPKILYYEKNPLSIAGAEINVYYKDNTSTTIAITSDMVSGYNKDTVGKQTITIEYAGSTATLEVEVRRLILQGVRLEHKETGSSIVHIELIQGGLLNLEEYSLRLLFQDGQSALIETIDEQSMVSGYTAAMAAGIYKARVNYQNFYAEFTVSVVSKVIQSVFVVNDTPIKREYFVGEEFSPEGLELVIQYDNNTQDNISYTQENAEDFAFSSVENRIFESDSFIFAQTRNLTQIRVTYLGDKEATFNVNIKTPLCIGMEIEFTDENGEQIDGRPQTYGLMREGEIYKSGVDAILEGDNINWATGRAKLIYEYGEPEYIYLNDPSVNGRTAGYSTTIPGNYTIALWYGEVEWSVPLNIIVKEKTPFKLLLSGTEDLESKIFVEGERINPDRVKYNVLYDNGDYLFYNGDDRRIAADEESWEFIRVVDMLSPESTLNATYITANQGMQTIYYQYENVAAAIIIEVNPLEVVSFIVTPPIKNYYAVGMAAEAANTNGYAYAEYNNNTFRTLGFSDDGVELGYYYEGERVYTFAEEGEYIARLTYRGVFAEYSVFVEAEVPQSLHVLTPPSKSEYISFNDINLNLITLKAVYPSGAEETFPLDNSHLYNTDKMRLGYQAVIVRYKGLTAEFAVTITGRRETSIEITKAPKSVYVVGEELDVSTLVINKNFNDASIPQEVREFPSLHWAFEIKNTQGNPSSLLTAGEKRLVITYTSNTAALTVECPIWVYSEAQITAITFNDNQPELNEVTEGGIMRRMLLVSKGEELNTVGLNLTVNYSTGASAEIDLLSSYVDYDKGYEKKDENGNPILSRKVTIRYAGKQTEMWIHIVYNRDVVSISVNTLPHTRILPELMPLKLTGGTIRRSFSDGTHDILPMTNGQVLASGYNTNPFANLAGGGIGINQLEQQITLQHLGRSTTFSLTTHRKLKVGEGDNMSYSDIVSFYGAVRVPSVEIIETIPSFTTPQWTLDYLYEGHWVQLNAAQGIYPKLPGTYPLRLNIIGNEYYEALSVEGANIIIVKKIIEIRANDALKIYGNTDPQFTYWTEGDVVVDGETTNTVLVWNNGVQDKLEIIVERDLGEDVLFGSTGEILGYAIRCRLAPPSANNQNDRYIVDFKLGTFRIQRRVLNQTIQFTGLSGLYEDGYPKNITAYYLTDVTNIILARDIIYTDNQGNILPGAPTSQGIYTATISNNYQISGERSREFIIGPPR